jgi:hypothetical protein
MPIRTLTRVPATLTGHVSGLWGHVDACALTDAERTAGVDITTLVQDQEPQS